MDLTVGHFDLTVYTSSGEACLITRMDNYCNTFIKCQIDTFTEDELQDCKMFEVPGGDILILSVRHFGLDAWKPEYFRQFNTDFRIFYQFHMTILPFRFFFDDGNRVLCPYNEEIDNEESVDILSCQLQNNTCLVT